MVVAVVVIMVASWGEVQKGEGIERLSEHSLATVWAVNGRQGCGL